VPVAAHTTLRLGLIADDLTGANDTAVQFARRGWDTLLALDPTSGSAGLSVIAVTTDSRALDNAAAAKLTAEAIAHLMDAGVDRIYLKIDSTMRGSVAGQIDGALAAWRTRHSDARAVVCPAYPRMGRTVAGNRLLVDGRPVEESPIGRDPVSPVSTGDMGELVPGSCHRPVDNCARKSAADKCVVATFDARSDGDLSRAASAILEAGPSLIPVGSAGLAEALAGQLNAGKVAERELPGRMIGTSDPRILIQVTSLNPVSRGQAVKLMAACPDVVVLLAPAERVGNLSVAERLGAEFAALVAQQHWDVLGLVGGDGARAALRHLGASGIRIVNTLLDGIPFGFVVGGRADGIPIFTKAGGFGAEDALVRVVERISK
jgi:uncharacterized protein YgbK (DUF1537 family)